MKQKVAPASGNGKPQTADEMAGNKLAGDMAEKAQAAIRSVDQVAAPSLSARMIRIDEFLRGARTIEDRNGVYGDLSVRRCGNVVGCESPTAQSIISLINAGHLDEETFQLTSLTEFVGQMICVCLSPPCRIGPFIPFRK